MLEMPQPARAAVLKRRHRGLIVSFALLVVLPLMVLAWYFWAVAEDQFASTAGFTVRSEEGMTPQDLLGGLAQFTGQGGGSDGDILYAFIQSQDLAVAVDQQLDLRAHYSRHWPTDWLFSLWPDASTEEMLWYWNRIVRLAFDRSSGLIEVRVLAFDPGFAQQVTQEIVAQSQRMINRLNVQAREDAIAYAQADRDAAVARLQEARAAITRFRTRTQIVDPAVDLQNRLGVMTNLQQQLAERLIAHDALEGTTRPDDPRLVQARHMLDVIRARIAQERQSFTESDGQAGAIGQDYPTLIAEYERLSVDLEFAENGYLAAMTAYDAARAEAIRQSRYLATYIQPTLASSADYPARVLLWGLAALFLGLGWSVVVLIYYSLRDRR